MKAMFCAALMVAAMVFPLPFQANAGVKAGSFEVGPFGGYSLFENHQNLEDSAVIGGRLGYNFTKHFGMEGVVEFIRSRVDDRTKTGAKEGQYGGPTRRVDLTFYHIDALYHFTPDSAFTPFIVAGFGGAHYSPEISTHDMAAFNVGIGAKLWLTDHIAFRVDIRDYMVTEIFQETYHNVGATAGVTVAFGGKASPVPIRSGEAPPETKADKTAVLPEAEPNGKLRAVILASEPKVEERVMGIAAGPKTDDKVIVFALEDIHFDFDKSTLTKEAQVLLKRNIDILKNNPKTEIRIAGYTSASGTEEYNQKLSERRANAVKEYLVNEGVIAPGRLSSVGYGETNAAMYEVAPKDLYSKAAKANMRVLFELIVK